MEIQQFQDYPFCPSPRLDEGAICQDQVFSDFRHWELTFIYTQWEFYKYELERQRIDTHPDADGTFIC